MVFSLTLVQDFKPKLTLMANHKESFDLSAERPSWSSDYVTDSYGESWAGLFEAALR